MIARFNYDALILGSNPNTFSILKAVNHQLKWKKFIIFSLGNSGLKYLALIKMFRFSLFFIAETRRCVCFKKFEETRQKEACFVCFGIRGFNMASVGSSLLVMFNFHKIHLQGNWRVLPTAILSYIYIYIFFFFPQHQALNKLASC